MIEIQLGYGALGSAPVHLLPSEISPEFRSYMDLEADEGLALAARLPEALNGTALANLVRRFGRDDRWRADRGGSSGHPSARGRTGDSFSGPILILSRLTVVKRGSTMDRGF